MEKLFINAQQLTRFRFILHFAGNSQATKNIKNTVDVNGHANIKRVWHKRSPCLSQRLRRLRRPALPSIAPWGSRRGSRHPTSRTRRIMPKQSRRKIRRRRLPTTTPSCLPRYRRRHCLPTTNPPCLPRHRRRLPATTPLCWARHRRRIRRG